MKIYPSGIKRIQNVSLGEETDCSMNYSSERMKIHATWNRNKSLSLPLYTVTHNAIYERERERERRIVNGVQWCVVFFNKNCWTRNIPLSERKGGRISGNLWKYSDLGARWVHCLLSFSKIWKEKKKKRKEITITRRDILTNLFLPFFSNQFPSIYNFHRNVIVYRVHCLR